jgi:crotonobetainyl-CoA:carnitine CoA-transferase CaiB-like acyl-CoA transferase
VQPLEGIRVIDLAPLGPGPHCSQIMADLGAEIVKVEQPDPKEGPKAGKLLRIPLNSALRRASKSIFLNLKSDAGREVFYKLVKTADVVIEGYRPGVAKRLQVDYETVRDHKPDIIYAALTGYGQDGPYAKFVGHDINYQAVSGILSMQGPRNGMPAIPGAIAGDNAGGGMNAVVGILAAILSRQRTGEGQFIDMAMVDGLVTMMFLTIDDVLIGREKPRRGETLLTGKYPWYNIYETKDAKYVSVGAIEPWFYGNLCKLLGREDLAPHQYGDDDKQQEVFAAFREAFLTKTRDEWVDLLMPSETCVAPVLDIEEVASNEHLRHREMITESGGRTQVGAMVKLSETPAEVRGPRSIAQDDAPALLSQLGYDDAAIDELRRANAIA